MVVRICFLRLSVFALGRDGSLSLGGKCIYRSVYVVKDTGFISLCALNRPFISLLASEFREDRPPEPPGWVFMGYYLKNNLFLKCVFVDYAVPSNFTL